MKIPTKILHYAKHHPDAALGGVETFARNLRLIFEDVEFVSEGSLDVGRLRDAQTMVICDNHWVTDLPPDMPVIGFQHGVAAEKFKHTRSRRDRDLAIRQARAARRPKTIWVACAQWISKAFDELHGNPADFVVYHHVDLERFDGRRGVVDPKLVLHDARLDHKGKALVARLAGWFPDWKFEALDCAPDDVPARLRTARAFLHLSRYEGNSLVCNEAMAMNLPCLLTNTGVMRDEGGPSDAWVVDREAVFADRGYLRRQVAAFLHSLDERTYTPRDWIVEHASVDAARNRWAGIVECWEKHAHIP